MAKGLTDIAIRNLKPGGVRREIPDPGCAGLYLIIQPSGRKSFAVRYRFDGLPRKLTLQSGVSLAAARKLTADAMHEVAQGCDPSEAKKATRAKARASEANTVRALCENYLGREAGKLRTGRERRRALERLVYPEIGDMPLADLKRNHIVKMLDRIEDRNGTMMAELTLAYVRKAFNWHAGRVDDFNSPIVRGMSRYDAKANQGIRVLSDDELRKLWTATEPSPTAPNPFHALVRFLLLTGARRDEARELPWSEIVGGNWLLPAARNKVGEDLVRPLSKAAQDILSGLPVIEGGSFVFSNDGRRPMSLTAPFARLAATIGVTDWRLHDVRRSARTLLSRARVAPDHAVRCLGHKISGVRHVYDQHKYHAEMATAYEALAAQIERIVNPPANVVTPLRRRESA